MLFMNATRQGLTPALVMLMSVATGLCVASNYYVQPLLNTIAQQFDLSVSLAGFNTSQLHECHRLVGEFWH